MISHLEIKGFKSLVDTSVDLGAVNVFIGANGSGKSNLLEAVGFLSAIVSGSLEAESIRYRGVRMGTPGSFRSSLKGQDLKSSSISAVMSPIQYHVEFAPNEQQIDNWWIVKESVNFESIEIFSGNYLMYNLFGQRRIQGHGRYDRNPPHRSMMVLLPYLYNMFVDEYAGELKVSKLHEGTSIAWALTSDQLDSVFNEVGQYSIFTPSTPQLRGFLEDIRREPLGLGGSGLGQAIDEMLRGHPDKLGPFDIEDVYELIEWADSFETDSDAFPGQDAGGAGRPIRLRIGDRFMGDAHKSVSLLEASEGALYVLFLLALVGHERSPKIFAVDNFDQALHPRLACALTRLITEQILKDGTRQMLATTHNPLVLDGLDLLDDRIRLFAVDRDPNGATQVHRVEVTEELMAQADQGLSLSRLWLMGRLGGVPKSL